MSTLEFLLVNNCDLSTSINEVLYNNIPWMQEQQYTYFMQNQLIVLNTIFYKISFSSIVFNTNIYFNDFQLNFILGKKFTGILILIFSQIDITSSLFYPHLYKEYNFTNLYINNIFNFCWFEKIFVLEKLFCYLTWCNLLLYTIIEIILYLDTIINMKKIYLLWIFVLLKQKFIYLFFCLLLIILLKKIIIFIYEFYLSYLHTIKLIQFIIYNLQNIINNFKLWFKYHKGIKWFKKFICVKIKLNIFENWFIFRKYNITLYQLLTFDEYLFSNRRAINLIEYHKVILENINNFFLNSCNFAKMTHTFVINFLVSIIKYEYSLNLSWSIILFNYFCRILWISLWLPFVFLIRLLIRWCILYFSIFGLLYFYFYLLYSSILWCKWLIKKEFYVELWNCFVRLENLFAVYALQNAHIALLKKITFFTIDKFTWIDNYTYQTSWLQHSKFVQIFQYLKFGTIFPLVNFKKLNNKFFRSFFWIYFNLFIVIPIFYILKILSYLISRLNLTNFFFILFRYICYKLQYLVTSFSIYFEQYNIKSYLLIFFFIISCYFLKLFFISIVIFFVFLFFLYLLINFFDKITNNFIFLVPNIIFLIFGTLLHYFYKVICQIIYLIIFSLLYFFFRPHLILLIFLFIILNFKFSLFIYLLNYICLLPLEYIQNFLEEIILFKNSLLYSSTEFCKPSYIILITYKWYSFIYSQLVLLTKFSNLLSYLNVEYYSLNIKGDFKTRFKFLQANLKNIIWPFLELRFCNYIYKLHPWFYKPSLSSTKVVFITSVFNTLLNGFKVYFYLKTYDNIFHVWIMFNSVPLSNIFNIFLSYFNFVIFILNFLKTFYIYTWWYFMPIIIGNILCKVYFIYLSSLIIWLKLFLYNFILFGELQKFEKIFYIVWTLIVSNLNKFYLFLYSFVLQINLFYFENKLIYKMYVCIFLKIYFLFLDEIIEFLFTNSIISSNYIFNKIFILSDDLKFFIYEKFGYKQGILFHHQIRELTPDEYEKAVEYANSENQRLREIGGRFLRRIALPEYRVGLNGPLDYDTIPNQISWQICYECGVGAKNRNTWIYSCKKLYYMKYYLCQHITNIFLSIKMKIYLFFQIYLKVKFNLLNSYARVDYYSLYYVYTMNCTKFFKSNYFLQKGLLSENLVRFGLDNHVRPIFDISNVLNAYTKMSFYYFFNLDIKDINWFRIYWLYRKEFSLILFLELYFFLLFSFWLLNNKFDIIKNLSKHPQYSWTLFRENLIEKKDCWLEEFKTIEVLDFYTAKIQILEETLDIKFDLGDMMKSENFELSYDSVNFNKEKYIVNFILELAELFSELRYLKNDYKKYLVKTNYSNQLWNKKIQLDAKFEELYFKKKKFIKLLIEKNIINKNILQKLNLIFENTFNFNYKNFFIAEDKSNIFNFFYLIPDKWNLLLARGFRRDKNLYQLLFNLNEDTHVPLDLAYREQNESLINITTTIWNFSNRFLNEYKMQTIPGWVWFKDNATPICYKKEDGLYDHTVFFCDDIGYNFENIIFLFVFCPILFWIQIVQLNYRIKESYFLINQLHGYDITYLVNLYIMNQQIFFLPIIQLLYAIEVGLTQSCFVFGSVIQLPLDIENAINPYIMSFINDPLTQYKMAIAINTENPLFTNFIILGKTWWEYIKNFVSLSTYVNLLFDIINSLSNFIINKCIIFMDYCFGYNCKVNSSIDYFLFRLIKIIYLFSLILILYIKFIFVGKKRVQIIVTNEIIEYIYKYCKLGTITWEKYFNAK